MLVRYAKIVALVSMISEAGSAYAVLNSNNTLSIQNDAVSSWNLNASGTTNEWSVSSDGPLLDSFFTLGGSKDKVLTGFPIQYAYLENGASFTLNGLPQSNIAIAPPWYNPWNDQVDLMVINTLGSGINILSASGDTATVDMSDLAFNWNGVQNVSLGSGAWSDGYANGVGNITCATGSACTMGSAYTLKYSAMVPLADPNGFANYKFYFEIHGVVGAVPEPSTYGMLLAGLGTIAFMVRRRNRKIPVHNK